MAAGRTQKTGSLDLGLETPSRTIGAVVASMEDGVGARVGNADGCRAIRVDPRDSWLRGPTETNPHEKKGQ